MTKPLHAGHCAKNGLMAAMLDKRDFTASRAVLEGHFGFGNLFVGSDAFDFSHLTKDFANPWELASSGVFLKAYPCCGSAHAAVDAVLGLRKSHNLLPEDIDHIEAIVQANKVHILIHPQPQTGLEGKFSLEYYLETAALEGRASTPSFHRCLGTAAAESDIHRPDQGLGSS